MKTIKLFRITTLALAITILVSCEKDDTLESIESVDEVSIKDTTISRDDMIAREDFPDELKNAIPISKNELQEPNLQSKNDFDDFCFGCVGGPGGYPFSSNTNVIQDNGLFYSSRGLKIYAIGISSGRVIDKLVVYYTNASGDIFLGLETGGDGGRYAMHYLEDDEYLFEINVWSARLIDRLEFVTNKQRFEYGGNGGYYPHSIRVLTRGNQIIGFRGRSGQHIDAIGTVEGRIDGFTPYPF